MNKQSEAYKLIDHINKNVCMGFSATKRPDDSVLLSYVGYEQDFEMSLEFSFDYKCWIVDNCLYAVQGNSPSLVHNKRQLGFITLALAKYNVALEKRLSK